MNRVSVKQRQEMGAKRCKFRWRLREVAMLLTTTLRPRALPSR